MLRLPNSDCKLVYYSVIIITLCFESLEKFRKSFIKYVINFPMKKFIYFNSVILIKKLTFSVGWGVCEYSIPKNRVPQY